MPGRRFAFEIRRTSSAPPATLFRLETDGATMSDWAKPLVFESSWDRQGDPSPSGVGAVRKVGLWPLLVREKTIEYDQDRRHVYELIGPSSPARGYRAEVIFTPNKSGGTDLVWRGEFTEALPGTGPVMLAVLRSTIHLLSGLLVKAAEREHSAG
ncbi:SRPBCC family protein [Mycobacterium sp. shizuoka-1]|jgi:uncharacterized protein YndB with AHSA1/START domain|uniref:SRPBCC family protein n=1 Tax=Mycobacteriaceae TaxID=1762 RepID=UPI000C067A4C|nr:SRPBCC family protein [Mycobacterium sp. shizuoka-1]GAY15815.1 MxaD family protein [Mycobacterium sp. shizuoka-1]